jgi:hypothetical protein
MYGLTRVANSASCSGAPSGCSQLVSVDPTSGVLAQIGVGHQALAALGDLGAIDGRSRTYYFLGGGWNSTRTFLVGLSLDTGKERCNIELPHIGEYGIVGGGQSLSLDTVANRLIITGLAAADGPHVVLTADLGGNDGTCGLGPFQKLGTFPYSGSVPVAHSSELDALGTTLYTDLATDERTYGIGVVDVSPLKARDNSTTTSLQDKTTLTKLSVNGLLKKVIPMAQTLYTIHPTLCTLYAIVYIHYMSIHHNHTL